MLSDMNGEEGGCEKIKDPLKIDGVGQILLVKEVWNLQKSRMSKYGEVDRISVLCYVLDVLL